MKRILYFFLLWLYAGLYVWSQHVEVYNDTVCSTAEYGVLRTNIQSIISTNYTTESIPFNFDNDFSNASDVLLDGVPLRRDDYYSDPIPIGFTFHFFGMPYDSLVIGANGDIVFHTAVSGFRYWYGLEAWQLIPDITLPYYNDGNNFYAEGPLGSWGSIMGAFHDIDPSVPSPGLELKYELRGTAPNRQFIITYNNFAHFLCNELHTSQQIVLNENDNSIEVHIKHKDICGQWNDGLAVLGIQNDNGTCGFYPGDNTTPTSIVNRNTSVWAVDSLTNPEAWKFTPVTDVDIVWFDANRDTVPDAHGDTLYVSLDNYNGPYTCEVTYYDCEGRYVREYDEGEIIIYTTPEIDLGPDLKKCDEDEIVLDATPLNIAAIDDPNVLTYNWYKDGNLLDTHTPQLTVTEPGLYEVEVSNRFCSVRDEVKIESYMNGRCIIPNVITPNDDNKNDAFILDYLNDKTGIQKIEIYNRWGHLVYEKENGYTNEWHGQNQNGDMLPPAAYYYVLHLNDGSTKTGWVYIIN